MNENDRRMHDIERDETWLRGFSTPQPDAAALERVKRAVRCLCESECEEATRHAAASAKIAVRHELAGAASGGRSSGRRIMIRFAPALAAAAAIVLAVVVYDRAPSAVRHSDTALTAFVATMSRQDDGIDAQLATLSSELVDLEAGSLAVGGTMGDGWGTGVDENDSSTPETSGG